MADLSGVLLNDVQRPRVRLASQLHQRGDERQREHQADHEDQSCHCEIGIHNTFRKRSVLSQWNSAPVTRSLTCDTAARETEKMLTANPRMRKGSRQIRLRVPSNRAAAAISK